MCLFWSLAYWFFTAMTPLSISAHLAKRTDLFAVANTLAAGACLLFNFWLIPRSQVWGAITATLASFILLVALVLYACQWPAPFKHNRHLITLSMSGLCITAWWSNGIHVPEPFALLFRGIIWLSMAAGLLFCFVRLYFLPLENSPLFPRILSWVKMNGNF